MQQQGRLDKVLKELVRKEPNLEQRIDELKQMYELNRYDELLTRLKDAENKNEYLAKMIAKLESNRGTNVPQTLRSQETAAEPVLTSSGTVNSVSGVKLSVEHIHSLEPLRIKIAETEEPRAPNANESEILIRLLFSMYKQQKQQVRNSSRLFVFKLNL